MLNMCQSNNIFNRREKMPRRRKKGKCVYCGAEGKVTDDHVPPKNLFPDDFADLIEVPACFECNNGFAKDDEYFRTMLVFREDVREHPAAADAVQAAFRMLGRPD